MIRRNFFRCVQTTAFTLAVAAPFMLLHGQNAPPASEPASLQEQLAAQYPLARMTTAGGCTVTNPETAVTLQQAGFAALPQGTSSTLCGSHYRNGSVTKPGFKCTYFLNITKQELVTLQKGDKVFPTKIEVGKNEVKVAFGYCAGNPGQATPYAGQAVIEFPKDSLKSLSVPQVEDKIAEVFTADSDANQQAQAGPDSAPPPPSNQDSPAQRPSIQLGETVDQVVTALGEPDMKAEGNNGKLIYVWKGEKIKVTFVQGKVADID
jgi:hypothetical protein